MTLADRWMAEGEARGEAKGMRRTLERQLQLKFKAEADEALTARLAAADKAQLTQWTERVLDAQTLAEVSS